MDSRILIVGGYGLVGGTIAKQLRKIGYQGELLLGGRHPVNGEKLAAQLGNARAVQVDVANPLPALQECGRIDLIIAALKDTRDALIHAALAHDTAHIGITKMAGDIAPIAFLLSRPSTRRPIVLLGHWQAGIMTLVARKAAQRFRHIDSVNTAALYDVKDPIGPMTAQEGGSYLSQALLRKEGDWVWVDAQANGRRVQRGHQDAFDAMPMGVLDVPSLASITGAANVRFDVGVGESIGTSVGRAASHDVYIEIGGTLTSGESATLRTVISDPKGQAHLTALGVVIAAEHVLGLNNRPRAESGLQLPETMIDSDLAITRLVEFGVQINELP